MYKLLHIPTGNFIGYVLKHEHKSIINIDEELEHYPGGGHPFTTEIYGMYLSQPHAIQDGREEFNLLTSNNKKVLENILVCNRLKLDLGYDLKYTFSEIEFAVVE